MNSSLKEPIFEAQVSVIQCNDDAKEAFDLAKDFEEMDFDGSGNYDNSSGF